MNLATRRVMPLVVIALIATVVTQILYLATNVSGTPAALVLWRSEAMAFLAIAILGFAWVRPAPLVAGGLILFGLLNLAQIGLGITAFGPIGEAGEALSPVMGAVVGLAFFFYHAAKVAIAVAALALGAAALGGTRGWPRISGLLAGLAGLAALITNALALSGAELMFVAGAAGTAATALLALALGSGLLADAE